jgi:hypothetical protein
VPRLSYAHSLEFYFFTELWRVSIGVAASWCHTFIAQSAEHDMNALDKKGDHATLYTGPECPVGN